MFISWKISEEHGLVHGKYLKNMDENWYFIENP
jgi:hypothetical protein